MYKPLAETKAQITDESQLKTQPIYAFGVQQGELDKLPDGTVRTEEGEEAYKKLPGTLDWRLGNKASEGAEAIRLPSHNALEKLVRK